MKLRNYLLNVTILILFGWGMVEFYNSIMEVQSTNSTNSNGFAFSLNILPIILLFIIAIPAAIQLTRQQRRDNKGWKEIIFFPAEFRERDEREKELTSKACRNSYISMMIVFPLLAICMLFQPFISNYFAAYPIVILMLFPAIQVTVYYLSIKRKLQ